MVFDCFLLMRRSTLLYFDKTDHSNDVFIAAPQLDRLIVCPGPIYCQVAVDEQRICSAVFELAELDVGEVEYHGFQQHLGCKWSMHETFWGRLVKKAKLECFIYNQSYRDTLLLFDNIPYRDGYGVH